MAKAKSWSVKGIDGATRDRAREAAQAAGLPIGAWIDQAILRARAGEFPELASGMAPTSDPQPAPAPTSGMPTEEPAASPTASETVAPEAPVEQPVEPPPQESPADPDPVETDAVEASSRRPIVADPDVRVSRPAASNDDMPPEEISPAADDPGGPADLRPLSPQASSRPSRRRLMVTGGVLVVLLAGSFWLLTEMSTMDTPAPPVVTADNQTTPAVSQTGTSASQPNVADELRTVQRLANAGDAKAQHDLGMLYLAGRHVLKDPARAAEWFEKAAVQGLANAQFNLGVLYQRGQGVAQNDRLAFFWYQSAAEQGMARAQHNLATAYADGRGTQTNYPKAVEWMTKAAEAGLGESQFSLASLYELGFATGKPDLDQARKWFERAAAQGDAQAPQRLQRIEQQIAARAPAETRPAPPAPAAGPVRKEEIMEIQTLLDAMNFNPGPVDGSLGSRTTNAIRLYQQFAGLDVDGKASRELLEDLRAVAATMSGKK